MAGDLSARIFREPTAEEQEEGLRGRAGEWERA